VTIVVTGETGGTTKPVSVLYVPADRQMVDAGSSTALVEARRRERGHLNRSVARRTGAVKLKQQYEHFGEETGDHVERVEQLVVAAGGDRQYVSASARASEKADAGLLESTFLLEGSLDPVTAESAMLESVMLAEAKDRANRVRARWSPTVNHRPPLPQDRQRRRRTQRDGGRREPPAERTSSAGERRTAPRHRTPLTAMTR
jgi:hypothetical protein